jgi:hypothetical protein
MTAVAHGVLPADAGAALVARFGSTFTSAVSTRFRLSVTASRSVIAPELGAMTVAVDVSAPAIAGGFVTGDTTVQR